MQRSLVAIAFVFGLSGAAKAESQDGTIVTPPFKFVAGGKTLPASYPVRDASNNGVTHLSHFSIPVSPY